VLAIGAFAFSLLQSLVLPAIPEFEHVLHTSTTGASWLLTAYLLSASIATPTLGRVGDMIGKKKMLVAVLASLAVGCLVSAVATDLPVMLAGRVVQGIGGAVFPLAFGIIRDEFPPAKVASGIGVISSILGTGAGAGMILAGPIVEHLSTHWLFWLPGALTVVATLATVVMVPESPIRASGRINWLGALFMSAWLVTGLVGVSQGPTWGWRAASVLGLFAATAVLFVLWIWAEVRSPVPVVDMTMMRNRSVWTTNLVALLLGVGMYAMFITVPPFVQTPSRVGYGFGASLSRSGLFLLPLAVAMLVVAPFTGRMARAVGSKALLVAGSVFAAASYGLLAVSHTGPASVYVATGLLGVGIALAFASMTNLIIDAVPAEQTGVATGMNNNIRTIGGAVGSAIATSVIVSHLLPDGFPAEHGYVSAFVLCAASLVVAAFVALVVPGRRTTDAGAAASVSGLLAEAEVFAGASPLMAETGR
jgi:EmrB/QacA subfamily drug resistance transporter